jgi:hypothetical protein
MRKIFLGAEPATSPVVQARKAATAFVARPPSIIDLALQFADMDGAFARHGGMVGGEELVHRMGALPGRPMSVLARWIVSRKVIAIDWQLTMLVPMFQFGSNPMKPNPACGRIVSMLSEVMDDWAIGLWFAKCNLLLGGTRPVDLLSHGPWEVLQAARAAISVAGA